MLHRITTGNFGVYILHKGMRFPPCIYFLEMPDLIKIGSTSDIQNRLSLHKSRLGDFHLLGVLPRNPDIKEASVHRVFKYYRQGREELYGKSQEIFKFVDDYACSLDELSTYNDYLVSDFLKTYA